MPLALKTFTLKVKKTESSTPHIFEIKVRAYTSLGAIQLGYAKGYSVCACLEESKPNNLAQYQA